MNNLDTKKLIICLGNGNHVADELCKNLSQKNNLTYNGILNNDSILAPGVWHTSVYDIKLTQINDKLNYKEICTIIVLNQYAKDYKNIEDYNDTIGMADELSVRHTVEYLDPSMKNNFRKILRTNKSFCILPFIGIYVVDQTIKNCCWQKPFRDTRQFDFLSDSSMEKIRGQMLDGIMVKSCQVCYDIEETGAISPRQDYTINWINRLGYKNIEDVPSNIKLRHYEITLGNKCNAMCRMCNPNASHLIDKEYKKIGLTNKIIGIKEPNHFTNIDIDSIMRLHVAGGESTISKQFENFLQLCIAKRRTDFEIYVSTNAYAISNKFLDLVKNFKNLRFIISIDGFEDLNYYIRYPIKWQKFYANISKLTKNLNIQNYGFNTVVSIYNISRLYDLYYFIDSNYPDVHCNMTYLTEPSFMVPWNFIDKDLIMHNLTKITDLNLYKKQQIFRSKIDGLIKKIVSSQPDTSTLANFFKFNDRLDFSRGVKLGDYIPELELCRSSIGQLY